MQKLAHLIENLCSRVLLTPGFLSASSYEAVY